MTESRRAVLYTIGHSSHSLETLMSLLRGAEVTAVCDVRSQPCSRLHPHFGRERLRDALRDAGIGYVFLGKELGGRTGDASCYLDGQIQYDRVAQTATFRQGLDRVLEGARSYRVTLLCAEKDPLQCHRTLLVARQLAAGGAEVQHILTNGSLESQDQADARLLAELGMTSDMFRSRSETIDEAYRRRAAAVAYRLPAADEKSAARADAAR